VRRTDPYDGDPTMVMFSGPIALGLMAQRMKGRTGVWWWLLSLVAMCVVNVLAGGEELRTFAFVASVIGLFNLMFGENASPTNRSASTRPAAGRGERPMIALLTAILLAFATAASAQTTFRDASGRTTGTVTTDSNGTKTFRDAGGRTTGTATRDSNGTTTFRDAGGRTTGTATAPRR
jgi:hypothetical protein